MTVTAPVEHPHAPQVGRIRRILGPFHVVGVGWLRLSIIGGRIVPPWAYSFVELLFTAIFFLFLFKIRRALAANLEPLLGPCGWAERQRRIFRTLWEFAQVFGERFERMSHPARFQVAADGYEHWEALATQSSGAIFVTAHVGAWDMSAQLVPIRLNRRIHVVREEELDPEAQEFVAELVRRKVDPKCVTHFATDDPRLGIVLNDALRRGEIVALQGDRPRAGSRSVSTSLFGRSFDLPAGPAALARASGVPLLPVFCFRESRHRYRVVFRPPITVDAGGERHADIALATRRLGVEVEWAIRKSPHQWFCFGQLWP